MSDEPRPHDLYRFYDADDRLLYIGISLNAAQRANSHRRDKEWWSDVARMDVQHLGTVDRQEAEQIEREAIRNEAPIHNIIGNDPSLFFHVAERQWIADARQHGLVIRGLCGYARPPLSREAIHTLPLEVCPWCKEARNAINAFRVNGDRMGVA